MKLQEARLLIRNTFENPFDKGRFTLFIKNLLKDDYEEKSFINTGGVIPQAFAEIIRKMERIGKYIDVEGNIIDILVVELKKGRSIEWARTTQRNFIRRYLNGSRGGELKDAALVAFFSEGSDDWRFSLIKMQYSLEKKADELTPAKRFSFLVGEDERSHTAQNQLANLLTLDSAPTLAEIESSFNIETVTKEFFEKYRELFLNLNEHIEKEIKKSKALREELESQNIDSASFTKKLLGQIVFLYFLQKKGWLGVPKSENWNKGDKQFLRTLLTQALEEKENFFSDYLVYLFYEALATEHREGSDPSYYPRLNCRIPFLNGGLFEADYNWKKIEINIPNRLFTNTDKSEEGDIGTGVLDVFDRYNFTVKEDEPLEKEVAVDPEMLGKVFENLLEVKDRKSKGAFYTPREIVHYMCQESLIAYLDTSINGETASYQKLGTDQTDLFGNKARKGQLVLETEHKGGKSLSPSGRAGEGPIERKDIEKFICEGISAIDNDIRVELKGEETASYSYLIPEGIRNHAKELDDALATIRICDPAIGSGAFPVGMMNEIVKAREILTTYLNAKTKSGQSDNQKDHSSDSLRTPYEFKRHAIQECIYGVDIDHSAIDIAKLRLWLSLVVDEDDFYKIKPLPNLDYKIVCGNSLIGYPYEPQGLDEIEKLKNKFFELTDHGKKEEYRKKINSAIHALLKNTEKTLGYKVDFDFKIHFSEVFHFKKGFDVVIGNPPYVQLQKEGGRLAKMFEKAGYRTFERTGDIYSLFYEKGTELLKPKGHLCFITSNKWMRAGYGESTRKFFAENTNPVLLIDFAGQKIFESATVDTNILLLCKDKNQQKTLACIVKEKVLNNLSVFVRQVGNFCSFNTSDSWVILSDIELQIKKKIERIGTPLKDWDIQINYGIKTGFNEAFIIDGAKRKELIEQDPKSDEIIRPILRGRDIKRYGYDFADLWLINTHNGIKEKGVKPINIKDYPAIKKHLDAFYPELEKRADKGETPYNLRNCAYMEDFFKQKIMYPNMTKYLPFYLDDKKFVQNDKSFMITGKHIAFVTAFLNSSVFKYCFIDNFPELQGGTRELRKIFLDKIPVLEVSDKTNKEFEKLVLNLQDLAAKQKPTKELEIKIDEMIFDLYSLTKEERKTIGFIEIQ